MKLNLIFTLIIALLLVTIGDCYYYEEESRPTYLTAAVGDHVVFNCDLDFPQGIRIPYMLNWSKEGVTVFSWYNSILTASDPYVGRMHLVNDPNSKGYGRASVNLTSIRETDNGWYECQLIFPNRTPTTRNNGTWFYLTVNGGALLAIPPINQTTLEGEEAKFNCETKEKNAVVTWYKDNIPIKNLSDIYQRSWITDDNTLIIRPTSMSDLGEYKCTAENDDGESQTATAYLNVQYKAKVIYAPREIYLPYGRSAMLDCHFRANPPLTNLRWEKDGFLFDPYNVQGVFYRRNGSLYFSKVDESHSGYYTCTPYNDLGTEGPSPTIHVIVQRPPVFIMTPQHLYLRKLGESLELPCDARDGENEHKPIIVWYRKDGSSLPVGRYSIREGNLTIINIEEEDRGFYQCSATNEAATITAETELIVENVPPKAPYNLSATSIGNSVNIKWMAGVKGLPVDYSVWYKPTNSKEWKMLKVSTKKALEATISNLIPDQEYEIMVLSKDNSSNGLFSKAIRVWTKGLEPDVTPNKSHSRPPIGFPRNVCVYPTSKGYLVAWDPPEFGHEELRIYVVRWYEGPREHLHGTAETKNTSYLVNGLEDGIEYHFQVLAMAFNDYQSASDKVTITVPPNESYKAISLGLLTVFGVVAAVIIGIYFIKKKWYRNYDNKKVNN